MVEKINWNPFTDRSLTTEQIEELDTNKDNEKCKVAVLTLSETCKVEGLLLANYLRENGFLSFLDYKKVV